jgi:hypothetical protein
MRYNVQGLETNGETAFTVIQFKRVNESDETGNEAPRK